MNRAPYPLVVVGLDGATFDIIEPLIAAGQLPNIARILNSGLSTQLESTQPTATLPAWTSFLTGANPGTHGIVDMFQHVNGTYNLSGFHGGDRHIPTCLHHLSQKGHRVACIGIPGTFPPERINGVCISGFDAPGGDKVGDEGIWPPQYREKIHAMGGWRLGVFNEHSKDPKRLEKAGDRLLADIGKKEAILQALYQEEPWDLFMFHLQASDTASHHAWHTWDPKSPRATPQSASDILPAVYRRLDQLIGWFDQNRPKKSRLVIVSDHGFGGASDYAVHINRWLHKEGYLKFHAARRADPKGFIPKIGQKALEHLPHRLVKRSVSLLPQSIKAKTLSAVRGGNINYGATQAFSDELDYAPTLWMNRRSRFTDGILDDVTANQLADEIAARIIKIVHPLTGAPLIARAHRNTNVFQGPASYKGADIVIEPAWPEGYRPSFLRSQGPGPVVRQLTEEEYCAPKGSGMPGVHHKNGVWIATGPKLKRQKLPVLEIAQGGALIYSLMGLAIPHEVQASLPAWLNPLLPFKQAKPEEAAASTMLHPSIENSSVLDRLHAMGYLD